MSRTAGHLIVSQLEQHGVRRVYAVPGESFLDVLDGLYDSPIETVVCRHEGGAGFMALAEARLTGQPGIAMVTRGPGAANAMIAVHTAWQDATPLVLFVGLIPVADRERDSFQEFSLSGWFSTTAKRVMVLDDEHRAAEMVAEAMRLASAGRPGPVVIGLPEDVLVRITDAGPVAPRALPAAVPSPASMEELAGRLAAAERPLLVVGGDGWTPEAANTLAAWAEEANVPAAADWRAYDAVPHSSGAWAGWLGYGRADTLAARLDEADLLVFVGCGRSDVLSDGYTRGLKAETAVVLPDPDAATHAGRIDQHILAGPAEFTAALPESATARGSRGPEWLQALAADQRRYATARPDYGPDSTARGVDLGEAFGVLERTLPADRIATYGAGNATIWGHRYLSHTGPGTLVGPRNGAMGLSVPAAVAAALVHPDRQVVAVCGDGDFLMNAQELAVAAAHGAAPLVIVVDNGIYGTIVQHQQKHYPGRPSGTAMANPDFAGWMRTFGGHGERVEATADFAPALERALASGRPALLHLLTDPETMPPGTANEALQGSTAVNNDDGAPAALAAAGTADGAAR
ncbi:acetolactate synthase, large subunit [Arthrobacter crystallopoietes BAB-32]|uniref:Acetolactate synthase, large subunit n=1 Tax=Arthrobacter crystallopoietes BAB-32 TaxID=1246476 RepID=N1UQL8_9MICC|nr:thiamine pyrophosphate-dependent enzyme [Arthrobacter crystallopoietes]EMY32686.1 acetolactate synthase, large subunit [Arthrobacter crystallopoietes BAB-32]